MKIIDWNSFRGFYVVSDCEKSYGGLKFHFWAETVEECREWISIEQLGGTLSNKDAKQLKLFLKETRGLENLEN